MNKENESLLTHFIAGIFAGLISFFIGNITISFIAMIAIAAITIKAMGKLVGKEKISWWIANGTWIYFFIWIISWTVLYNM